MVSGKIRVGVARTALLEDGRTFFDPQALGLLDSAPGLEWEYLPDQPKRLTAEHCARYDVICAVSEGIGPEALGHPLTPRPQLVLVHRVVEARHRHSMRHRRERGRSRRPRHVEHRLGRHELRMLALDLAKFANELVVVGVGDFRVVGAEVPIVVIRDQFAEFFGTGDDALRRCHA